MSYNKQSFRSGQILTADNMNHIEDGLSSQDKSLIDIKNNINSLSPKVNQIEASISTKQDTLVSGVSIKTVNGQSILGGGNIQIDSNPPEIQFEESKHLIPVPVLASAYKNKKIAFVGDSITQGVGTSLKYSTKLCQDLQAVELNLGASGTVLCTGGHRGCNISKLNNIDDADYVFVLMGVNDWDQAKAGYYKLGTHGAQDTSTIYGAVDMWCKKIVELKKQPAHQNTKFFFGTPIITSWNNSVGGKDWNQDKTNIHGFKFRDLCEAIIVVCADYNIPVFDMNKYSGIYYNSPSDNNTTQYGGDGIHPNTEGHKVMAESLKKFFLMNHSYVPQPTAINFLIKELLGTKYQLAYPDTGIKIDVTIPITSINLSKQSVTLNAGGSESITASLIPSNTTQRGLKWTSNKQNVATVDNGLIRAIAPGSCTITCESTQNTSVKAQVSVQVNQAVSTDLTALNISQQNVTVTEGKTATLTVGYVPSNTHQKGIKWTSENQSVATVKGSGESCTVTAVKEGQCNIVATSTVSPSITAKCFFTTTAATPIPPPSTGKWVLGSNCKYDSATEQVTSPKSSTGVSINPTCVNETAIYNVPLKKGMEIELYYSTVRGSTTTFLLVGLDPSNVISSTIKLNNSWGLVTGLANLYLDNPSQHDQIMYFTPEDVEVNKKTTLASTGNRTMPKTIKFKRDVEGVVKVFVNDNEVKLPDNQYTTRANQAEDLYAYVCGLQSSIYFKVNYIGNLR